MGLPIPGGEFRGARSPATIWLILINIAVYLLTSYENSFIAISDRWVGAGAFIPALIAKPDQAYRLFTSMFLHANLIHIFFNMLFLYNFGKPVETALGSSRYLVLYFLAGLLSEVFHTAFIPLEGAYSALVPAIGASGAISGVLGAYLLLFPGTKLRMCFLYFFFPLCFTMRAAAYLIFWFALQIFQGYLGESLGVAVFAHAGGFIGGLALLPLFTTEERLQLLRAYTSMHNFFYRIFFFKPGLSSSSKVVISLLIGIVAAGAVYSAVYAEKTGEVSKILSFSVKSNGVSESESITVQLQGNRVYIAPITSDSVRVVVNRLRAMSLIYNKENSGKTVVVDKQATATVNNIPVRIQIKASLSFDGSGVLESGRGYISTDVLRCDQYGRCVVGERRSYEFEARTEASIAGFKGIPISGLSMLSLLMSVIAIMNIGRSEHYAIIP
ncbi:MAG: rhomboid family intramembrane serine protease [Candidatus Methanodesulfokora sp.]